MTNVHGHGKYGITALKAANLAANGIRPEQAWKVAASEVFPDSPSSQNKGCPKSAFLGLPEAGLLLGIRSGKDTNSVDNKRYAVCALKLLRMDASLAQDPDALWRLVMQGEVKRHKSQMNVVISLWNAKKFVGQIATRQTDSNTPIHAIFRH